MKHCAVIPETGEVVCEVQNDGNDWIEGRKALKQAFRDEYGCELVEGSGDFFECVAVPDDLFLSEAEENAALVLVGLHREECECGDVDDPDTGKLMCTVVENAILGLP